MSGQSLPPDRRRHRDRPRPSDEWAVHWIGPEDRARWIAAGLGEHDARIAATCVMFGLRPDDLSQFVAGRTVAERLRSGESVRSLRQQMAPDRRSDTG